MSIIVGNRVYCKITALDDDDDVPRGSFQFPGQNFVNNIRHMPQQLRLSP